MEGGVSKSSKSAKVAFLQSSFGSPSQKKDNHTALTSFIVLFILAIENPLHHFTNPPSMPVRVLILLHMLQVKNLRYSDTRFGVCIDHPDQGGVCLAPALW